MKVVGTIQDISSRSVAGNRTAYGIVIDGNNYSVGLYAPRGVAVGDNVEFEVEVNGQYRNVARGTLRKVYGAAATASPPSTPSPAPQASTNSPIGGRPFVSDTDRQSIISKQAALNTAISYVNVLLETESVPLPKTAADRLAFIESLVFDSTAKFHKFSTGNDVEIPEYVGTAGQKKAAAKKAAAEEPTAEEEFPEDSIPF